MVKHKQETHRRFLDWGLLHSSALVLPGTRPYGHLFEQVNERSNMTEHNLFQEVQEDLERQKLEALWKKYGPWIVATALGMVLSTAGSTAYRSWKGDRDKHVTSAFLSAIHPQADTSKNIDLLQKFADEHATENQTTLALLRAGILALEKNDTAKAIELFNKVALDTKADPAFRQFGDLLSVEAQLDTGRPSELSARLQPLTAENSAWRFSALEAEGHLALRAGDKAKAAKIFTDLSQDQHAPRSLAARAGDILRTLN